MATEVLDRRRFAAALLGLTLSGRFAPAQNRHTGRLELHVVPTPIRSYRLLSMSRDDDGFIWAGSIHRAVHRYDPRDGRVETIPIPFDATAASFLAVGPKVYVLGQSYPRLIVLDRAAHEFREREYGVPRPDVWYGTEAIDGFLYLFDRGSAGVIRWDTRSDQGKAIPFPYDGPLPSGGRYEARDGAIWCQSFDLTSGLYYHVGISRLDLKAGGFTGWYPYPEDHSKLEPFADPDTTFFVPLSLNGKLLPFDFRRSCWCCPIDVPGYGQRFGFLGGPWQHRGRWYYSVSTYNGTALGCDGRPFHFCNAVLEFDPVGQGFDFLTLDTDGAYNQFAYMLSAGGEFFITGTNIRETDGNLVGDRKGEVIFWHTIRPKSYYLGMKDPQEME